MCTVQGSNPLRESIERSIARIASRQYGLLSREQARGLGLTRRVIQGRIAAGRWDLVHPGVFRIAGTPALWRQALLAACFAWGEGTVVSHQPAAALRNLPGFEPGTVELTVPRGRQRTRLDGVIVHRLQPLPPADVASVDGIPVTAVARTLIDIASIGSADAVEEALDDALRRKLVSLSRLRWRLSELGRSGRPGISIMRSLLAARDGSSPVPESVFETRLLRVVLDAGVPRPVLQYPIRDGRRIIAYVDFAYPSALLAIEAEGYRWHSGKARWESDLARRNALTAIGWRVLHVTWKELSERPNGLIERIRLALSRSEATEPPSA